MQNNNEKSGENAGVIQFSDTEKLLDIRYDNIFKAVFTKDTPASKGALSGLVSDLIQRKVTIETIIANEPPIDMIGNKRIRFDISCKAESGEKINIEMSFNPEPDELARLEYYHARLHAGQSMTKSYNDLSETYLIAIIGKEIVFKDNALFHEFYYYDRRNEISFNGKTRIITVELEKSSRVLNKPVEEMKAHEKWAAFFQYLTVVEKREIINEILINKKEIAMAGETLVTISQDEREWVRLETELKNRNDYISMQTNAIRKGLAEGRAQGFAEGKAEGRKEGQQEIMNLLDQGLSIEELKQRLNSERCALD